MLDSTQVQTDDAPATAEQAEFLAALEAGEVTLVPSDELVEAAIVAADSAEEVAEIVAEVEKLEDDEEQDDDEPVEKVKAVRAVHEHKPSIAYVEMIVRKREERGGITKAALKQYREDMLTKHGLPVSKKDQAAYLKAAAEAKLAVKAAAKAERAETRAALKAQKDAEKAAAVETE